MAAHCLRDLRVREKILPVEGSAPNTPEELGALRAARSASLEDLPMRPGRTKTPRARPRFALELPLAPDAVVERVRKQLEVDRSVSGAIARRTLLLTVCEEDTHFWSPHLDVQLDDGKDGGTLLTAMFAPHPQIWTGFLAIQALFAFLSIGAAVWLTSVLMLGQAPLVALGTLGLMLFGGGFAYGAAYVGQGLGSEQMYVLRAFLDAALREGPSNEA
jgi:hypothetical protein